jgi:hypothetical protein
VVNNFFKDNCPVYEVTWKRRIAGQATDDNMTHVDCVLDTWLKIHTHNIYYLLNYYLSTTIIRTRLITLYCIVCLVICSLH